MIRICTKKDLSWLLQLAIDCYPPFDTNRALKWLESIESRDDIIVVRGEHSAALAFTEKTFWDEHPKCVIQFICSRKATFGAVEVLAVIKYINNLRKKAGCAKLRFSSSHTDLDILARRLKAKPAGKSYVMED